MAGEIELIFAITAIGLGIFNVFWLKRRMNRIYEDFNSLVELIKDLPKNVEKDTSKNKREHIAELSQIIEDSAKEIQTVLKQK